MDDITEVNLQGEHDNDATDAAFCERVAHPMRAHEQLGASFEARVMAVVHTQHAASMATGELTADQNNRSRGWWRRSYTVHVSPMVVLATAAGFAIIVLFGQAAVQSHFSEPDAVNTTRGSAQVPPASVAADMVPDTVHILRFVLMDPRAQSVSIVGDFNSWDKTATPLATTTRPGVWTTSIALPPGRHEYAFIVHDGSREHWILDPASSVAHDDFSTESSVVVVPRTSTPEHTL